MKVFIIIALIFLSCNLQAGILNGRILEINHEYNFVIVNLGKEDGVKRGMIFLVYREKKLLGKVEVEDVFKDMSSCNILPWYEREEIRIDDGVLKP